LVICGNGELRSGLEASAAGLDNVRFIDLQPASNLNVLLNMADIHVLPQLRGAAELVMPSKLTGMLASGRPVVAAGAPGSEVAGIVVGCGIVTEPECADGFAQAISALAKDAERRHSLGAAARDYAERVLDIERILDRVHLSLLSLEREPLPPAVHSTSEGGKEAIGASAGVAESLK
jgi:colanic acid biosynthesis glycosyl transferase WcaI